MQPGMVRISLGLYNDFNEIDLLVYLLIKLITIFHIIKKVETLLLTKTIKRRYFYEQK